MKIVHSPKFERTFKKLPVSLAEKIIEPGLLRTSSVHLDTGCPSGNSRIKDNDAIIFFNFREDSMRQLAHSFIDKEFDKFPRKNLDNVVFLDVGDHNLYK